MHIYSDATTLILSVQHAAGPPGHPAQLFSDTQDVPSMLASLTAHGRRTGILMAANLELTGRTPAFFCGRQQREDNLMSVREGHEVCAILRHMTASSLDPHGAVK